MPPKKLASKAEFARLAGVSRPAITKACKGVLAAALVDDRIDLNHPAAKRYLIGDAAPKKSPATPGKRTARAPTKKAAAVKSVPRQRTKPSRPRKKLPKPTPPHRPSPKLNSDGSCDELAEWTLEQIVEQFGSIRSYKDILEAHEKRERARKNRLDNEKTEGQLIERERVRTHVLGFIEASHKRILGDASKTIASRTMALVRSGANLQEVERFVRETLGATLRPARDAAVRNLRRKRRPKPDPNSDPES